ncbi:unnamed protein product [Cuscuta campestris]|uniref:Retrotransposon gag domain-containing protein n=1 Tax=Cuscuta campestris TaxID=132261 RepID=A0A484M348_9ASTE|nr:unnamed protein product [Cuscuta campestris]
MVSEPTLGYSRTISYLSSLGVPLSPRCREPPHPRRFNLEGFLTGEKTSTDKDDIEWLQLDALIQGWILSTVNDEVSDLILSSTKSAVDLWTAVYNLFHDNKAARAMQLEHQFYSTVKVTSTIATYCQNLRNIVDWLDNVDAPVTENQLVLQVLRGLPDDLSNQASFLQFQKPPPTFMETRSALVLLERNRRPLASTGDGGPALAATTHGGAAGRVQGHSGGGGQQSSIGDTGGGQLQANSGRGQAYGGRGGRPARGRGRGRNFGGNPRQAPGQQHPWQIPYYNPNPGLLGPRPTQAQYPARAYFTQPSYTNYPSPYPYAPAGPITPPAHLPHHPAWLPSPLRVLPTHPSNPHPYSFNPLI